MEIIRRLGYAPQRATVTDEISCVRRMGGDYPRFHIYLKEEKDVFNFSIHLDQKKPIYEGSSAHNGEYESDVVREEVARIKSILMED